MDSEQKVQLVARRVDAIREQRGIAVLTISDLTGIPRPTLQRRLKGLLPGFTVWELTKISKAFEVDFSELVGEPSDRRLPSGASGAPRTC